jgi:hypothetical protein
MRDNQYRPSLLDHVPKTKRGHGTTHPNDRVKDGQLVRRACRCVEVTCTNNMRVGSKHGDAHEDQEANANEWKDERGFNKYTPFEQCFA